MAMFKSKGHPVADMILVLRTNIARGGLQSYLFSLRDLRKSPSHADLLKNLPVERDMKALRLFTDSMWKRTPWKEKTSGKKRYS